MQVQEACHPVQGEFRQEDRMPTVPTIDLSVWRTGSASEREAIAAEVDYALQRVGFLPA